jgi:hypothetical protein
MKMFMLYVGTKRPGAKETILKILREHFASFTLIEGEGQFRGSGEPMWLVKVATDAGLEVINVAVRLRRELGQDGVGIEFENRYYRCTEADEASGLRKLLGLEGARGRP